MKEKPNIDCEKYRQIAQMAKMGWWESDLKNRQYICSDFIIDLLGLESNRISFEDSTEEYGKTIGNGSEMNTFRSQT